MISIRNKYLKADISENGAEMQSFQEITTGREYLWQGDAEYWNGRSPLLFPATGGLWNGTYRYKGQEFQMVKHGFAKKRKWTYSPAVAETDGSEARFVLDLPEGDEGFPFPCRVEVTYSLHGRTLRATFRVYNLGTGEMFFQMGGHPALNLPGWDAAQPVGGYLEPEGTPAAQATVLRAGEQGCTGPERFGVPQCDGLIPVSEETFSNEALIFDRHQLSGITLLDTGRRRVARIRSGAPVWLFWQPQGKFSPFVCAEPWYGLCDPHGFDGDVSERPYINCLPAGECWEGWYEIETF